jgi:Domain of Unknown Function (DUF928)
VAINDSTIGGGGGRRGCGLSSQPTTPLILLKNATTEQQRILYAKNGIWFDALTTLGDLRRSKPKELNAIENWNRLLQSIGLENLKTKLIVNCCTLKSL